MRWSRTQALMSGLKGGRCVAVVGHVHPRALCASSDSRNWPPATSMVPASGRLPTFASTLPRVRLDADVLYACTSTIPTNRRAGHRRRRGRRWRPDARRPSTPERTDSTASASPGDRERPPFVGDAEESQPVAAVPARPPRGSRRAPPAGAISTISAASGVVDFGNPIVPVTIFDRLFLNGRRWTRSCGRHSA